MKGNLLFCFAAIFLGSCTSNPQSEAVSPAVGSWRLISGLSIEQEDTTFTDYSRGPEGIKLITPTHFSFLIHDRQKGRDSTALFVSGGGRAQLEGLKYTEHLDYCNYREWEGLTFHFELELRGDTLIQSGIEKVEETNTERKIIETYVRMR